MAQAPWPAVESAAAAGAWVWVLAWCSSGFIHKVMSSRK